jgi:hypothetical protein
MAASAMKIANVTKTSAKVNPRSRDKAPTPDRILFLSPKMIIAAFVKSRFSFPLPVGQW